MALMLLRFQPLQCHVSCRSLSQLNRPADDFEVLRRKAHAAAPLAPAVPCLRQHNAVPARQQYDRAGHALQRVLLLTLNQALFSGSACHATSAAAVYCPIYSSLMLELAMLPNVLN